MKPTFGRQVAVYERLHREGRWQTILQHPQGRIHGFGYDVEEDETGFSTFSVAIVELPDGAVIMPRADNIKFLDGYVAF